MNYCEQGETLPEEVMQFLESVRHTFPKNYTEKKGIK